MLSLTEWIWLAVGLVVIHTVHNALQYTMHYSAQCITVHNALHTQCITVHNALQCTMHYITQCITVHNALQYTMHYSTQCITVHTAFGLCLDYV